MNAPQKKPVSVDDLVRNLLDGCVSVSFISVPDSQVSFRDANEASRFAIALHTGCKGEMEVQVNLPRKDDSPKNPYVSWRVPGRIQGSF